MKKITTKLPAGKIVEIKELDDGTFEVVHEVTEEVLFENKLVLDDDFILIEAESLSLNDNFIKHKPRTRAEEIAKNLIAEAIKGGVKNFYRPIMDPSFTNDGIGYVSGKKPAVGKSYHWWIDTAKKYDPSRNSRLGTRLEYGVFLGVLIKKLVEKGKSVEWAWDAVCNNSKELGHYSDSENARDGIESTGSRLICGFCDLGNTFKILAEDVEVGGYWLAGGNYNYSSDFYPIADICLRTNRDFIPNSSVGWIVLS